MDIEKAMSEQANNEICNAWDIIQYLVDNWPTPLEDGGYTLPDGTFLPQTKR